MSRALEVGDAWRKASIISRPIRKGWPCLPENSGTTAQMFLPATAKASRRIRIVPAVAGGRSTNVTIAASRPWLSTARRPTCKELNWPWLGLGFTAIEAPLAYVRDASAASLLPATTTTKSAELRERIAAVRNVSLDGDRPGGAGGQGSRAFSVPMREDSPAARISPAKLGARDIERLSIANFQMPIGNEGQTISNRKFKGED